MSPHNSGWLIAAVHSLCPGAKTFWQRQEQVDSFALGIDIGVGRDKFFFVNQAELDAVSEGEEGTTNRLLRSLLMLLQ